MRIIVTEAKNSFAAFIRAAQQDPSCWQNWRCIHIQTKARREYDKPLSPMSYMISRIGTDLQRIDGTSYMCDQQNIFIVCRPDDRLQLRTMLKSFVADALIGQHIEARYNVYDIEAEVGLLGRLCEDLGYWHVCKTFSFEEEGESLPMIVPGIDDFQTILQSNIEARRQRDDLKILLVEDDMLTRRLAAKVLKDDVSLITAPDAVEAVVSYVLYAPNMVFLDIGLPDFSGYAVMQAILSYDPDAYIVMFSGHNQLQNIVDAIHAGANGFVEKPFRHERLTHYINQYRSQHFPKLLDNWDQQNMH